MTQKLRSFFLQRDLLPRHVGSIALYIQCNSVCDGMTLRHEMNFWLTSVVPCAKALRVCIRTTDHCKELFFLLTIMM